MELYEKVTSYEQLLDLNVKFINDDRNLLLFHQKPIENTGPLKQTLIELNQKGFLTLGGQCAVDTPTFEKKLFLDGYLDPKLVRNFIKHLKGFKKIEFFIEFPNKQIKTNIRNWKVSGENQAFYFNSLARTRKSDQEEWTNTDVLPFKSISSYITSKFWKPYNNVISILKNYAFVHLQHHSFHDTNNDIYTIINDFLKGRSNSQFGLKRKYVKYILGTGAVLGTIGTGVYLRKRHLRNKPLTPSKSDLEWINANIPPLRRYGNGFGKNNKLSIYQKHLDILKRI